MLLVTEPDLPRERACCVQIVSELWGHHSVSITGDIYGHVSAQARDVLGKAIGGE